MSLIASQDVSEPDVSNGAGPEAADCTPGAGRAHPFGLLLGVQPRPAVDWPADKRRVNTIWTAADAIPVDAHGIERNPSEMCELTARQLGVIKATEAVVRARVRDAMTADQRRHWRDKEAAERGEFFLPLQPGQKRRRRAGPDGQPLKRAGAGVNSRVGYVRTFTAEVAPAPPPAPRVVRAPGEMTYGEAARTVERWKAGEAVELEDLARAQRTIDAAKARTLNE